MKMEAEKGGHFQFFFSTSQCPQSPHWLPASLPHFVKRVEAIVQIPLSTHLQTMISELGAVLHQHFPPFPYPRQCPPTNSYLSILHQTADVHHFCLTLIKSLVHGFRNEKLQRNRHFNLCVRGMLGITQDLEAKQQEKSIWPSCKNVWTRCCGVFVSILKW